MSRRKGRATSIRFTDEERMLIERAHARVQPFAWRPFGRLIRRVAVAWARQVLREYPDGRELAPLEGQYELAGPVAVGVTKDLGRRG